MSFSFSARIIASKKAPRERTRTITSPGRMRRSRPAETSKTRSAPFGASQALIVAAMRRAAITAGSAPLVSSSGMRQSSRSGVFVAPIGGQTSIRPGRSSRSAWCGGGGASSPVRPRQARSAAKTASTPSRTFGAERNETDSGTAAKASSRLFVAPREPAAHRREHMRRGALEGEDRLLLVADGEEGALGAARAFAGQKLLAELGEDRPLRRRGVLRLVDQEVLQRSVELVEHPGGVGALEQRARAGDEIVVVEQAARAFQRRVAFDRRLGDAIERDAALERLGAAQPVAQRDEPLLFGGEALRQGGQAFGENVGDEALFLAAARLAVLW